MFGERLIELCLVEDRGLKNLGVDPGARKVGVRERGGGRLMPFGQQEDLHEGKSRGVLSVWTAREQDSKLAVRPAHTLVESTDDVIESVQQSFRVAGAQLVHGVDAHKRVLHCVHGQDILDGAPEVRDCEVVHLRVEPARDEVFAVTVNEPVDDDHGRWRVQLQQLVQQRAEDCLLGRRVLDAIGAEEASHQASRCLIQQDRLSRKNLVGDVASEDRLAAAGRAREEEDGRAGIVGEALERAVGEHPVAGAGMGLPRDELRGFVVDAKQVGHEFVVQFHAGHEGLCSPLSVECALVAKVWMERTIHEFFDGCPHRKIPRRVSG